MAVLKKAAVIADDAEADVLKSYAIGLLTDKFPNPGNLNAAVVCILRAGPNATRKNLSVFTDAVETVKKVGEAPSDTSYSGYVRKFRENAANAAPKDYKTDRRKRRRRQLQLPICVPSFWPATWPMVRSSPRSQPTPRRRCRP